MPSSPYPRLSMSIRTMLGFLAIARGDPGGCFFCFGDPACVSCTARVSAVKTKRRNLAQLISLKVMRPPKRNPRTGKEILNTVSYAREVYPLFPLVAKNVRAMSRARLRREIKWRPVRHFGGNAVCQAHPGGSGGASGPSRSGQRTTDDGPLRMNR